MQPGSMFQVNYPKQPSVPIESATSFNNATSIPENNNCQTSNESANPFAQQQHHEHTANTTSSAQTNNTNIDNSTTINDSNAASEQNSKSMLLVKVPPGTAPYSKINVQIPGEDRYIEAVVPPNVDEFFVEYTVNQNNQTQQNSRQTSGDNAFSSLAPMIAAPLLIGAAGAAGYSMINNEDNASDENFQDNDDLGDY